MVWIVAVSALLAGSLAGLGITRPPSASAQAAALPYTCAFDTIAGPQPPLPVEVTGSASGAASVDVGTSIDLSDVAVNVKFNPDDFMNADLSGGSLTLGPNASQVVLGPGEIDDEGLAAYSGLTAQLIPGVPAGTTVVVSLDQVVLEFISDRGFLLYRFTCTPNGDPVVLARVLVTEPATCLSQAATIVGAAAQTTVTGTPGDDVIVARAPGATITPGAGADKVCAAAGGGTVSYADSAAGVWVALNVDKVLAAAGVDELDGIANAVGSRHGDILVGDDEPNVLRGGDGNDLMTGLSGADTLDGGRGANLILGDREDTCLGRFAIGCG